MLACSLAKSVLLSASMRPTSASVLIIAGRLNVTSSVVFTSPALVLASSRTVHCIKPAPVVRHQPGRSARDRQATCPRFLTPPLARGATSRRKTLQTRIGRTGQRAPDHELAVQLALARQSEAQANWLARDIWTLVHWLRHDVLALAGPDLATRRELFDFIVAELAAREPEDARRIRPVRVALQNQRDDLLAFAGVLDNKLADIARVHAISELLVRDACVLHRLPTTSPASGMVRSSSRNEVCDEGAEQGVAASTRVVHKLEEAEIKGQLVLRDAPVWAQPGAQQRPKPLHRVDVDLARTVAVLVAGILAAGVADRFVFVALGRQARVDGILVGVDEGAFGDVRLDDCESACYRGSSAL